VVDQVDAKGRTIRTIRLDAKRLATLLDSLDDGQADCDGKRAHQRYTYRVSRMVVYIKQPGDGSPVGYEVAARNISSGGVAFLHGGFVHNGTRCAVQLVTPEGKWKGIIGGVVGCRHVEQNVHEIRVRFDQPIDAADFTPAAVTQRILIVDHDEAMAGLMAHHLAQLQAEVDVAKDEDLASQYISAQEYDAVLMDLMRGQDDGLDAVSRLRAAGYPGFVVCLSAVEEDEFVNRAIMAGCDRHLPKPLSKDDLEALLHTLREEPLVSTLADDAGLGDLIDAYVGRMPERIRDLTQALIDEDRDELMRLGLQAKSQGSSFGFDKITLTGMEIESRLLKGKPLADVRELVVALIRLYRLTRRAGTKAGQGVVPTPPAATPQQEEPAASPPATRSQIAAPTDQNKPAEPSVPVPPPAPVAGAAGKNAPAQAAPVSPPRRNTIRAADPPPIMDLSCLDD
jgi:DNA-binding response OmpR family regulator